MTGLDTNLLVRYLVQDDPDQSKTATRAMEEAAGSEETLFVNSIVLCELVWVLETTYRFPKSKILSALELLLRTWQIEFEDKDLIWAALSDYASSKADFSDCLVGRINAKSGCGTTWSLDRTLKGSRSFTVL